ncbi:MAG: YebC/PmpR family DNA-binding transcriptional regulator [Alphaproteobacteria bacterium]
MAGHSQFKNIMHRKGAKDAKKAKIFTKVTREIISAAKLGMPDPAVNPRLRAAMLWAREENMPRDKIEAAIKRGSGNVDTDNFEEVRYEGYGAGGVAVIVQALTDNRNRSASDIRSIFTKYSGNMGETGSVSFMFDRVGLITYPVSVASEEAMFEAALEAGADNCDSDAENYSVSCSQDSFGAVRDVLEKSFGAAASAKITWLPKTTAPVNEEQAKQLIKMVEALEDNDDVQEVFTNVEIPESMVTSLSA